MATEGKKPSIRIVHVKRSIRLTHNMQRVTLTGPELIGFPSDRNGANLKLLLPDDGVSETDFRKLTEARERPTTRTFTVRAYRESENELDIDFVAHGDEGPASRFAIHCAPQDYIGVAGPGPMKLNRLDAEWYLFCADMSALPAAAAAMENLPGSAKGVAFFEITDPSDTYPIAAPSGIQINWLVHRKPRAPSYQQLARVKALDWPPTSSISVFAAGEHNSTMAIRDYLLKELNIPRDRTYISGYWKIGLIEDQHQIEKREDAPL